MSLPNALVMRAVCAWMSYFANVIAFASVCESASACAMASSCASMARCDCMGCGSEMIGGMVEFEDSARGIGRKHVAQARCALQCMMNRKQYAMNAASTPHSRMRWWRSV